MHLYLQGNDYHFELENISRLFLPLEKIVTHHEERFPAVGDGLMAECSQADTVAGAALSCRVRLEGFDRTLTAAEPAGEEIRDRCELTLCTLLYRLLSELLDCSQTWGLVTGVRPVKLLRRLVREMGREPALAYFREKLLVSDEKLSLCCRTLDIENEILSLSRPDSFSLYVSVPFCPTRCDYCSFVSQTVERAKKLIPAYVEQLCRELRYTGELVKGLGLHLETVYFGGGTPTTLSA